jgi:succinoglycan biosynthesis transport protein ExoP
VDVQRPERNVDVRASGSVLWSNAPFIVLVVVVVALGTYLYSSSATDLYRTTARVRLVDPSSRAGFDEASGRGDPQRDLNTQLSLLRSHDLRASVTDTLGTDASLLGDVTFSGENGTDIIQITASSSSPEVAQRAADAYAEIYVSQRQTQMAEGFAVGAQELREQAAVVAQRMAEIDAELSQPDLDQAESDVLELERASLLAQQADLRTRATELDVEAATRTSSVEIAETAPLTTTPYSPTPKRDAAMAGIVALFAAIGLAFLRDRLDDRLKDADDVEEHVAPVPVLGDIPSYRAGRSWGRRRLPSHGERTLVPLDSAAAEAFRTLRTSLRFSAIDTTRTTIVVTSSDQGEGKSTITANLAMALAESGLRVVVVSADLRRPSIEGFFGVGPTDTGLTSVLLGDAPLGECLQRIHTPSGQRLYLLPAGPLPHNPAELLASKGMRDVITAIERSVDYVLIDTPPVRPVSDAMAVAQFADGVLVLTVPKQTRGRHLTEAIDSLRQVHAEVVGVVVNGTRPRTRYGGYDGYGETSGASRSSRAAPNGEANGGTPRAERRSDPRGPGDPAGVDGVSDEPPAVGAPNGTPDGLGGTDADRGGPPEIAVGGMPWSEEPSRPS